MTTVAGAREGSLSRLGPLVARAIRTCLRMPELVIGPLIMSAFFLIIYHGQLSATAPGLMPGTEYIAFLVPLVLLTAAFTGGAVAGQLVVRDLDSGYFSALALTPTRRGLLATAPALAGMAVITMQALVLIGMGALLGLEHPNGYRGATVLLALTIATGTGFLLLALAAGLIGRSLAWVNAAVYVFFPLSFMTATFVPRDHLQGWLAVVARFNPLTYLLEAMRDTLTPGWDPAAIGYGGVAALGLLALGLLGTWAGLRRIAREKLSLIHI